MGIKTKIYGHGGRKRPTTACEHKIGKWRLCYLQFCNSPNQIQRSHPHLAQPLSPKTMCLHGYLSVILATTEEDSSPSEPELVPDPDDSLENRLYQVRLRNRSGTGKKAELRKSEKGKKSGSGSGTGSSVFLPPVSLKEPVSEGLNVEFGFSPFSERLNGRIATLGLSALLSVELATGQGVINYHSPSIVFIQLYFVAAVSALYVKFEKERISVWP